MSLDLAGRLSVARRALGPEHGRARTGPVGLESKKSDPDDSKRLEGPVGQCDRVVSLRCLVPHLDDPLGAKSEIEAASKSCHCCDIATDDLDITVVCSASPPGAKEAAIR